MIEWQWSPLTDLPAHRLYAVLAARVEVFVVEQNCPYQDLDGLDLDALHLIGWSGEAVAAYLRVLDPGTRFAEPSLGRILTTAPFRGTGAGRLLMKRALELTDGKFPMQSIRISAQAHLQRFYGSFGFVTDSDQYLEDGIPHVEMLREAGDRR